jgi:hypothetical protein
MDRKRILRHSVIILGLLLVQSVVYAATQVGEVVYARGVLTGQLDNQSPQILGKGFPLHKGETLNTGSSGFAVIKLEDGSRMTLRPNTTFKIENVETTKGSESALMSLIRGGFRAITGFISKSGPDAFRINTRVANIGIRGTDFDARLCEGEECAAENKALNKQSQANESSVIGRIALLQGKANALDDNGKSRPLTTGAAVYELDQIQTGIKSFAVISFKDETRVTMSSGTAFKIEEHRYAPAEPEKNNAFFRFIRGGLRLLTGAIGHLNRRAFRVATPTATIGIRGTGFDLACDGDCVDNTALSDPLRDTLASRLLQYFLKPAYAVNGNGMYVRVWRGAIELQYQGGTMLLEDGKAAFLKNGFSKPVIIPKFPVHLRSMGSAPRPDRLTIRDDLFSGSNSKDIKPGLYVNVRDGDVAVEGTDGWVINLGKNEAGLAGLNVKPVRLNFIPSFQKFDKIPEPSKVTPKMQKMINLFGVEGGDKQEFECRLR